MPHSESPDRYCFDRFELQPGERRLLVDGAPIAVGPRAFDLLLTLIERAGQLVTKDALLERVWPKLVVEENNLQVQISTLRKLLGQDAIATVVGKGYRFTRQPVSGPTSESTLPRAPRPDNNNLPCNLGTLIGRERELGQLHGLLADNRLVTVTGSGGVGKTRLMIACALGMAERFAAGVWLVELAAQTDPSRVPATLASALGIEIKDTASATETLIRQLRDKQMLLLLDNCEHLIDAVTSMLNALLSVAPQIRVLTSSQEVLGVAGEQVFRLPSLTLPEDAVPSAAVAQASGAVSLFVERARAADLGFRCDDRNAPTITSICRRLDGIPLAIEMAAARVATLGLDDLAKLLDERLRVLTGGRRGAIPRQRTLQATLDWSYGLLAPRERIVFRRLAGFVGGFSLAAALAVAADAELDQFEVIDSIAILVAKSLLAVDSRDGHARYRLLETTRAYALEKLAEAQETARVARRAAEHYRLVFKSCFDDWTRLSESAFDARYAPELDNLRLALDWSFGPDGDPQTGLALMGLSGQLWAGLSMLAEAQQRLDLALANLQPDTPPELEADLQLVAGTILYWRRSERAISAMRRAVSLYRTLGNSIRLGYAQMMLGSGMALGGVDGAEEMLRQAQSSLASCGRPRLLALLPKSFGVLYHMRGMAVEAAREFGSALELSRAAGYDVQALTLLENLADMLWMVGDLDQALAAARDIVERCKQVSIAQCVNWDWVYGNLFGILTERGELAEAAAVGRQAMPHLLESGTAWSLMDHYALHLAKSGQIEVAARVLGWIDSVIAPKGVKRQPNEARAMQSTLALLRDQLPADELARLCAEGAQIGEEEACRLALP